MWCSGVRQPEMRALLPPQSGEELPRAFFADMQAQLDAYIVALRAGTGVKPCSDVPPALSEFLRVNDAGVARALDAVVAVMDATPLDQRWGPVRFDWLRSACTNVTGIRPKCTHLSFALQALGYSARRVSKRGRQTIWWGRPWHDLPPPPQARP